MEPIIDDHVDERVRYDVASIESDFFFFFKQKTAYEIGLGIPAEPLFRSFTLALVRFPPTVTKEIQYLNAKGALTYTDIAGDPVLYGNLPPREISMKDVFRSGDSSKKFKIAEGQWYRYAPSYVSPAYHLLEGFPFIQEPPSGDLQERVLIRHPDYDQCFQSVQLLQWNSQVKFNVTVYRNLPTTRDSIMTS